MEKFICEHTPKYTIEDFKNTGTLIFEKMPDGWIVCEHTLTQPKGYVWISNNKSLFSGKREHGLLKIKEVE